MNDLAKQELIQIGLKYLDDALCHIMEVKDCERSSILASVIRSAIGIGESVLEGNEKNE